MNKWLKYGMTGVAILAAQVSIAENQPAPEEDTSISATMDIDMDEFGGSKLKDRMLDEGGPAVEIVRAVVKSQILKEVES